MIRNIIGFRSRHPDAGKRKIEEEGITLPLPEFKDRLVRDLTPVQLGNLINLREIYHCSELEVRKHLYHFLRVSGCDFCVASDALPEAVREIRLTSTRSVRLYHKVVRPYGHLAVNHPDGAPTFVYPNKLNLEEFGQQAEMWTAVPVGDWSSVGLFDLHDFEGVDFDTIIDRIRVESGLTAANGYQHYYHREQCPGHFHFHIYKGSVAVLGQRFTPAALGFINDMVDLVFDLKHDKTFVAARFPDFPSPLVRVDRFEQQVVKWMKYVSGTFCYPHQLLDYALNRTSEKAMALYEMLVTDPPIVRDEIFYTRYVAAVLRYEVNGKIAFPNALRHSVLVDLPIRSPDMPRPRIGGLLDYDTLRVPDEVFTNFTESLRATLSPFKRVSTNEVLRPEHDRAGVKFREMAVHFDIRPKSVLGIGEFPGFSMEVWKERGADQDRCYLLGINPEKRKVAPGARGYVVFSHDVRKPEYNVCAADLVTCDVMAEFPPHTQPYQAHLLEHGSMRWALANLVAGGSILFKVMSSRLPYTWYLIRCIRNWFVGVWYYKSRTTMGNDEVYVYLHSLAKRGNIPAPFESDSPAIPACIASLVDYSAALRGLVMCHVFRGRNSVRVEDTMVFVTGPKYENQIKTMTSDPEPFGAPDAGNPQKYLAFRVKKMLGEYVTGRVVDIGCGTGYRKTIAAGVQYTGIDIDPACSPEVLADGAKIVYRDLNDQADWVTIAHSMHNFQAALRTIDDYKGNLIIITHEERLPAYDGVVGFDGDVFRVGTWVDRDVLRVSAVLRAIRREPKVNANLAHLLGLRHGVACGMASVWRVLIY